MEIIKYKLLSEQAMKYFKKYFKGQRGKKIKIINKDEQTKLCKYNKIK